MCVVSQWDGLVVVCMRLHVKRMLVPVAFGEESESDYEGVYEGVEDDRIVTTSLMVFPFNETAVQLVVVSVLLSDEEAEIRAATQRAVKLALLDEADPDSDS